MTTPAELFDLSGKVAVVTGGGTGIGRQMAEGLAEAGASVVLCARDGARCEAVAAEVAAATGVEALGIACDTRDREAIEAMVALTLDRFGAIDILVNNAGTTWGAPPEETPLEGWQKVIDVNLTGVFLCSQAVGRHMLARGRGKIVNIASVMGSRGAPAEQVDSIAYNTSKGGVVNFTRDLGVKWAPRGVYVNAIAPGWFPSIMSDIVLDDRGDLLVEQIPLGRVGGPDELKGAVVFLSSAASDFVAGHILAVDGGQGAR
jgi:NAD(P)-dependent dehydrogenase (short-subunit alcohol dehydrogenase family)